MKSDLLHLAPNLAYSFAIYCYLQGLDLLTTLALLLHGYPEGNPVVRFALENAPSPLWGLAAVKLIAMLIGVYCWIAGRASALRKANILFALAVAWNTFVVLLTAVRMPGGAG